MWHEVRLQCWLLAEIKKQVDHISVGRHAWIVCDPIKIKREGELVNSPIFESVVRPDVD